MEVVNVFICRSGNEQSMMHWNVSLAFVCLPVCHGTNFFTIEKKKCLGFCLKFFVLLLLPWCREDLCYEGKRLPFILNMASKKNEKETGEKGCGVP